MATPAWITQQTDQRLYEIAKAQLQAEWGDRALLHLGRDIRRALLAEKILAVIAGQDEEIRDSTVRRLVNGADAWLDAEMQVLAAIDARVTAELQS